MTTGVSYFVTNENATRSTVPPGSGIGMFYVGNTAGQDSAIGFQSVTLSASTNNAVVVNGLESQYAFSVDATGALVMTDNSGDATNGQTINVSGASYLLFNGAATTTSGAYNQMMIVATNETNAEIARFYQSTFGRAPDLPGYEAWTYAVSHGVVTLQQAAQDFISSSEFTTRYGAQVGMSDLQYVTAMYTNVLGRAPDQAGLTAWTTYLSGLEATNGSTAAGNLAARAQVLQGFATSQEEINNSASWLIDCTTGGTVANGTALPAATVLNQGVQNNYINIGLMALPAPGVTVTSSNATFSTVGGIPGLTNGVEIVSIPNTGGLFEAANVSSTTFVISSNIFNFGLNGGSGDTIYGSSTAGGQISLGGGSNNTIVLSSAATSIIPSSPISHTAGTPISSSNCSLTVIGFNPAVDVIYLDGLSPSFQSTITLLNAATGGTFNGASLSFNQLAGLNQNRYVLALGGVGDGSTASVAAALKSVYTLGGSSNEHLEIIGQVTTTTSTFTAGDTVVYDLLNVAAGGGAYAAPSIDSNLYFTVRLVGVTTSTLTTHSLGSFQ